MKKGEEFEKKWEEFEKLIGEERNDEINWKEIKRGVILKSELLWNEKMIIIENGIGKGWWKEREMGEILRSWLGEKYDEINLKWSWRRIMKKKGNKGEF